MTNKIVQENALNIEKQTIKIKIKDKEYEYLIKPFLTYIEQQTLINSAGDAFINGVVAKIKQEGEEEPKLERIYDGTMGLTTNLMLASRTFDEITASICCPELYEDLGYDGMLARGYLRMFPQWIIGYSEAKQVFYAYCNDKQLVKNSLPEFFTGLTEQVAAFLEQITKETSSQISNLNIADLQKKTGGTAENFKILMNEIAKHQKDKNKRNGGKTA